MDKATLLSILTFLVGIVTSLAGSYFLMGTKIAYIKGQLEQIIEMIKYLDSLRERVRVMELVHEKLKTDLNHAHEKIRNIVN